MYLVWNLAPLVAELFADIDTNFPPKLPLAYKIVDIFSNSDQPWLLALDSNKAHESMSSGNCVYCPLQVALRLLPAMIHSIWCRRC